MSGLWKKKYSKCNMKNHFAKICRSRDQESQRRTQKPAKSVSKKPRGEFIELKKSNQQSPMMKFTACIQSLTAAVLNTWFNLSWEVNREVIGLRWPCRLIADQRLIACYVYRWPLVGTAWNKTRVLRNSNMAVECWYVTWCQNSGISSAAEWNLAQRYGRRIR